ncbi:MAG: glycosyltransferase family 2 protein [Candidatus Omnitrophica bacterium]|nr:glycosyltransferase family 2 protein [Candidatus Omnitrophota bacterium]
MDKNSQPLVSIIILNYNGKEFLKPCLDSVLASTYHNFEIIVVDNASVDDSVSFLKDNYAVDRVRVISEKKNYGVPGGRNIGFKYSHGDYIIFLDNDAVVGKGWIEGFLEVFSEDEKIAVAQAKLLSMLERNRFDHAGDFLTPFGFLVERSNGAKDTGQFDKVEDIFNAKGAATMIKSAVFKELGMYDDSYFMYLEETDFCWRAWLAGYKVVFAPKSVVWHAYSTPLKDEKKYYSNYVVRYYGCRNYLITALKNAGSLRLLKMLFFQLPSFLILSLLFCLRGKFSDAFFIIKALFSVVADYRGIMLKRNFVQNKIRRVKDRDLFPIIQQKKPFVYYLDIARRYVKGEPY